MTVTFFNTANVVDDATLAIGGPLGVTFAYVAGHPYLYVGGLFDSGISAFSINTLGQLTNVTDPGGNIRDIDNANLAIGGTQHLAALSTGSTSFLYAAGGTENGVSAFAFGANGAMINPA